MESRRSPIKRQPAQSDGMPVSSEEILERNGVPGAPGVSPGDDHIMFGEGEGHGDGESKPEGQGLGNAVLMQSSSLHMFRFLPAGVVGVKQSSGSGIPSFPDLGPGLINISGRIFLFMAKGDTTGAAIMEAMSKEPGS